MKQTTIFDYFPKSINQKQYQFITNEKEINSQKRVQNVLLNKNKLIKTYVQKNLSQLIEEQKKLQRILDLLGKAWHQQENGFGFTDKNNIMIISTIQDFNKNFFTLYKFEDFKKIENLYLEIENLSEEKNKYVLIKDVEYNYYYLSKAIKILGDKWKTYQHEKLKLIFLRNNKFAALICPKF